MDVDLAEYDQMDEAKYFISHRAGALASGCGGTDLLTTLSSERAGSIELANCENDYVFLPPPPPPPPLPSSASLSSDAGVMAASKVDIAGQPTAQQVNFQDRGGQPRGVQEAAKIITPDQLDIRSHRPTFSSAAAAASTSSTSRKESNALLSAAAVAATAVVGRQNRPEFVVATAPASGRLANPLMSIHSNGNNNPFFNSSPNQQVRGQGEGLATGNRQVVASQPFWMRSDNFANKPIGLLESGPCATSASSSSHLSDLMHQIVTKSDSIFIAIPCLFCQDSKSCPPSDISAWMSHMNRVHNCKPCPICNKLVGLGPMRDIEIMRKHVVAHIDDEWLERRSAKSNFSFGLQQQWFTSTRCTVKDPRTLGLHK